MYLLTHLRNGEVWLVVNHKARVCVLRVHRDAVPLQPHPAVLTDHLRHGRLQPVLHV